MSEATLATCIRWIVQNEGLEVFEAVYGNVAAIRFACAFGTDLLAHRFHEIA